MKDEAFQAWDTTLIQSLVMALIFVNQSLQFFFTLSAEDMFPRMHENKIKGIKLETVWHPVPLKLFAGGQKSLLY